MTTLDWYLISKKELYLSNLWSAYFGDMLENYRALSKKRLGPFSGNRKKKHDNENNRFKSTFQQPGIPKYELGNIKYWSTSAQHSRTSQTKYQIRSTIMEGCPCLRRFIHLLKTFWWISTTSNDFAKLFSSEPVSSNKMPTYIKARKYKM